MIKIFNKKKEITIQTNGVPVHILKNFLLSFPSNIPKYFKDIPKSFFDNQKRKVRSRTTIRTCSGFINLFKRSIVFTSPYDIELFIEPKEIKGHFNKGDHIKILDKNMIEFARGLSSFTSDEISKIKGQHSNKISNLLGYISKSEVIHKDDMVKVWWANF